MFHFATKETAQVKRDDKSLAHRIRGAAFGVQRVSDAPLMQMVGSAPVPSAGSGSHVRIAVGVPVAGERCPRSPTQPMVRSDDKSGKYLELGHREPHEQPG